MTVTRIITEIDWAWAAGLFEGEGTIYWHSRRKNGRYVTSSPQMAVHMTDRDVVYRFAEIVESLIGTPGNLRTRTNLPGNRKQVWEWSITGVRRCRPVLQRLLPYFGERRGAKACEVLAKCETIKLPSSDRTHCPKGHPYAGDNLYLCSNGRGRIGRHCRSCRKERDEKARLKRNATKLPRTHCKLGHPQTAENVSVFTSRRRVRRQGEEHEFEARTVRRCLLCQRLKDAARRKRA